MNTKIRPEISVIMPVLNGEQFIHPAILSVLNQSFKNFELIIIDDGSTDNTAEIVKSYSFDERVKYFYQDNTGLSGARNTGISLSQGDYVAFIDCDDIWYPKKIELQLKSMKKNPKAGLSFGWISYIDERDRFIGYKEYRIYNNFYENLILGNYVDNGSVPLIKRECFDKIGYFDPTIAGEDWDMWIRIAREYEFVCVNDYLVKYRIYSFSMSKNYKKMIEGLLTILNREFLYPAFPINNIKRKAYAYRYFYSFGVARNLLEYKDAIKYLFKALSLYPELLLEGEKLNGIFKLLIMSLLPRPLLYALRQYFKNMLIMYHNKDKKTSSYT
jgi:glycosyltransferase involved in cell wall biosynthesis